MEITFVRHGRSALAGSRAMTYPEFARWTAEYDATGIRPASPPESAARAVQAAGWAGASDLARSAQSAAVLAPGRSVASDPVFREVGLELAPGVPPGLRLPAGGWGFLLRAVWVLLWSLRISGARQAYLSVAGRVDQGASLLEAKARESGSAVLVGHGFYNILLAGELRRRGWQGPLLPAGRHWGVTVYKKELSADGRTVHGSSRHA